MSSVLPPVLAVRPDERPTIVCPPWCVDGYEQHLEELGAWDGFVIHHSAGGRVWHSRGAYPDNTVSPDDPPTIWVDDSLNGMSVDDAEKLAHEILAAVEESRR